VFGDVVSALGGFEQIGLAAVLLLIAGATSRRTAAGLIRQGRRIGALEQQRQTDVLRLWQLERVLIELGVPLPPWPGRPSAPDVDPPVADPEPQTVIGERPVVPPFPDDERARLARHRR
jgi:hypothetical protein